jgi:biotin synthase
MIDTHERSVDEWQMLAEHVLSGEVPTPDEALTILTAPDSELLALLSAAYRIRSHYFGNTVKLNYLVNAKSGICPEDCHYCSQSHISTAEIERYPMLTQEEIVAQAEHAVALKATTCCIVTSARRPSRRELEQVTAAVGIVKSRYPHLKICACLGMLTDDDARLLRGAGVDRYNHNLNTSEAYYEQICTTHTHAERVATVEAVARAGISPCSGLIVGMGETLEDIVDASYQVRESGADSIPINTFIPIPGTPLHGRTPPLNPRFCLKVLCLFRFVCADREIRVSAGRERHFRSLQPLSLYAANSIFVGDYLTTEGQSAEMDWAMIEDLGFVIEDPA